MARTNPTDLTTRNARAASRRDTVLRLRLAATRLRLKNLEQRVSQLAQQLRQLTRKG